MQKYKVTYRSCGIEKDQSFEDADVEYRSTTVEEYEAITEEQVLTAMVRFYDVNPSIPELDDKQFKFFPKEEFEEFNREYKKRIGFYNDFVNNFKDFVKSGQTHFVAYLDGDRETVTIVPVETDAK